MKAADYRNVDLISEMISETKTIAVVGISDRPDRPSYEVADYLKRFYKIIPVNPKLESWQGEKCYPSLSAIPVEIQIDLVDVFRRSSDVAPVVDEAVARRVKYIWLQQGIYNADAAATAEKAGIKIVMDACLLVEHARS